MRERQYKYITLAWLRKVGACNTAIIDFQKRSGTKALVKTVVDNFHKINRSDWEAWLLGQELGLTIAMIQNGADIHVDEDNALQWAAYKGHLDMVKYLLKNGLDIHAGNDTALRSASRQSHLEVVKYLLSKGANIHAADDDALRLARVHNHLEVVEYLERIIQKEKR